MRRITPTGKSFEHFEVDLLNARDDELGEIGRILGLGLSIEELRYISNHYVTRERMATDVELQTYDQTFSEHCSHKTFRGYIETPEGRVDGLLKTYIKGVVDVLKPSWCYSVFEDNAGIVDLEGDYKVAIKVETHNHPSAIEPFGGAATGLGGVIRDILGVWADPIACTDVLCFGPLDYPWEKLPEGVKHPSYLFNGVVDGIGSYGNSIGIPTVNGATLFAEEYTGNVVVYAGCVGILKADQYIHQAKAGDMCVLAGGRTGLDGIHGVTFASAELTKESEQISRPAVQIANPIEEEKLKRAIQQISEQRLGSAITDIGGGGLSCGVCETADKYGLGIDVDMDKIPLKAANMAPWEIWISESQERMLLAVPPENLERVLKIFRNEQTEANAIGCYNDSGFARLSYKGVRVADIHLKSLFNPPKTRRRAVWTDPKLDEPVFKAPKDLGEVLLRLLSSYNVVSKEKVVRRYDQEVKGQTVVKPMQGWNAGPSDSAVMKPLPDSMIGVSISSGINPRYGKISPYWMAASVIDEAIRNNIAVGGRRLALLDNFTWGSPEYMDRIGSLVEACRACHDIGLAYGTPFISGKDSLYNESPLGPIVPTLLVTALGIVPSIEGVVTMDLKEVGDSLYLVGETAPELGGSEYYNMLGYIGASVPRLNAGKKSMDYRRLTTAIDARYVRACHDLSEGGLAVSLTEMAFTGGRGVEVDLAKVPVTEKMRDDLLLFSESNGRLLVEVSEGHAEAFERIMKGSMFTKIGIVTEKPRLVVTNDADVVINLANDETIRAWKTTLEARQ